MPAPAIQLSLSHDQALVLFEFFSRFDETESLTFAHPAEYLALQAISEQLDKALLEPFQADFKSLLTKARESVAANFQGEYPGPKC